MSNKVELFNDHLKEIEQEYKTRPQFQYRLHRPKQNNFLRVPMAVSFRPWTGGWLIKGMYFYLAYYVFVSKFSIAPYLNRQDYYSYDKGHHTSYMPPLDQR